MRRRPASRERVKPECSTSTCSDASSTRRVRRSCASTSSTTAKRFLHKRAVEMCEYIKSRFPAHLPLHEHERPGALGSTGAAPGAFRYRRSNLLDRRCDAGELREVPSARSFRRGDRNLRAMADEKRRSGRDVPFLNWRYILFIWNDSDAEMDLRPCAGRRDRRRSPLLGNHRSSRRRVFASIRAGIGRISRRFGTRRGTTTTSGNAIPGATPRARIDVRTLMPGAPLRHANGPCLPRAHTSAQPVDAPLSGAGQLRTPSGAPRGAVVRGRRHADQSRLRASVAARNPRARRVGRRGHRDPGSASSPGATR